MRRAGQVLVGVYAGVNLVYNAGYQLVDAWGNAEFLAGKKPWEALASHWFGVLGLLFLFCWLAYDSRFIEKRRLQWFGGQFQVGAQVIGEWVYLTVETTFPDNFEAKVTNVEGALFPQTTPWTLKWRDDNGMPKKHLWRVTPGPEVLVDLAELVSLNNPAGEVAFRLFSVTQPNGFLVGLADDDPLEDESEKELILDVYVRADTKSKTANKRVHIGFDITGQLKVMSE